MMPLRIVIDTNVVISGTFFGGKPRQILEAVVAGKISAVARLKSLKSIKTS